VESVSFVVSTRTRISEEKQESNALFDSVRERRFAVDVFLLVVWR
jgi:hypothetical protein